MLEGSEVVIAAIPAPGDPQADSACIAQERYQGDEVAIAHVRHDVVSGQPKSGVPRSCQRSETLTVLDRAEFRRREEPSPACARAQYL